MVGNLLSAMQKEKVTSKLDRVSWRRATGDRFSVGDNLSFSY